MTSTLSNFQTIRDMLRYAVTQFNQNHLFFGHGSSNAFDEAAYLILHTLSLPIDQLNPFLDAKLTQKEIADIDAIIQKRIKERLPAAYLTHEAWLQGYKFYVDSRVLIPRSFIAELILEEFSPWFDDRKPPKKILELCTGSACLAIMLADVFSTSVDAVDLSSEALEVAQKNVNDYGFQKQIKLIQSDLFENVPHKKYDLIIANPPYVNTQSMKKLPKEYLHEPQMALAGGKDGMDLVRRIIQNASNYLNKDGLLIVEIGNEADFAIKAFPHLDLTWLSTSGGDDRVFLLEAEQLKS